MEPMTLMDVLMKELGSPAMWLLILCSAATLVVTFERGWYFASQQKDGTAGQLMSAVQSALSGRDHQKARQICRNSRLPLGRALSRVFDETGPAATLHDVYRREVEREVLLMERYIGVLGTIGNVAPYVGLFGTVLGVMRAFRDLGSSGASGPSVVMQGLSQALIATAVGLIVAVGAVVSYNYFLRRIKRTVKEMQIDGADAIDWMGKA